MAKATDPDGFQESPVRRWHRHQRCRDCPRQIANLPNARFESADFLQASFENYDVIAAIECVNYLSLPERGAFLEKVANEHAGKILLLSGPIVDYTRHFGHRRLMHEFKTLGFAPLRFYNLSLYWHPP